MKRLFQAFNKEKFDGKLPEPKFGLIGRGKDQIGLTHADMQTNRIEIDIDPYYVLVVEGTAKDALLHEMVHEWEIVESPRTAMSFINFLMHGHGPVWEKKARKLGVTSIPAPGPEEFLSFYRLLKEWAEKETENERT